jgi:hypothetical protein
MRPETTPHLAAEFARRALFQTEVFTRAYEIFQNRMTSKIGLPEKITIHPVMSLPPTKKIPPAERQTGIVPC